MPLAGTKVDAPDVTWRSGSAVLTDKNTFAAINSWEDWGTETIQFDDPGIRVAIVASGFGNLFGNSANYRSGQPRLAISIDGGATFTTLNDGEPPFCVVRVAGDADGFGTGLRVEGVPTGDIVVKMQGQVSDLDVDFRNGYITAIMHPV
ncbi:hypothetical protein [Prauserella muralis]|uniref:Uncharacterized protein n=1 Tax=Prauserella muralis TaxID=588067 RepID=A0A2V4AZL6_9PSEU|nr:hypothetical protein [Prauserella muralis]PXY27440.1 hypothetical protein BAY60_13480 [Prauserella muralis]TWE22859.1 hypothetical protein FHX69_4115 [Prauserella muralis]